ncbi:MAG: thiamine pyrophosphate-dependent enzyme, partial [Acidimicrobiia bacterium]|nr:thiamine pyrophosphate-dependent enzyme [Acidimicrobiia bacterium]
NPDFAEYARLCGGQGWRVTDPADLPEALNAAMAVTDGPSLIEVEVMSQAV